MSRKSAGRARPRVIVHRAVDTSYPRSERVLRFLRERGADVRLIPPATGGSTARQAFLEAFRLLRVVRPGDVVLLAEMQLKFAPVTAAVARLRGARLVVDGFIGLHETYIEDWQVAGARSWRARRYRIQDAFARRSADLYLVDTEVRAVAVREGTPGTSVLSLPVGAPAWATHRPVRSSDAPLRVLYYGNYIPLHGVPVMVEAIASASRHLEIEATFIGSGTERPSIEQTVSEAGLDHVIRFVDPVAAPDLAVWIERHDVVLGVFGGSSKAATVVPNKVWQGLAAGRTVITRRSAALDELPPLVAERLVQVPPADTHALAAALRHTALRAVRDTPMHVALETYVQGRFAALWTWLTS